MRTIHLKSFLPILFVAFSFFISIASTPASYPSSDIAEKMYRDLFVEISDAELTSRIQSVTNLFEPRFTNEVKSYLRVYLTSRPEWTQTLLGRAAMYFPIFERKIEEKGMPNDIKIISIIESALRTCARSCVGAQGLWQFMPGTAKMNDLVIDKYVDERDDPYRATDAALEYLTDLYGRYHDWALAIAAYNSGPGRVNQARAISRKKSFWDIKEYLPKETRNYVPAFLAAAYMMKYYSEYYIIPENPRLDFQITKAIKVYDEISFDKISRLTGLSKDDLRFLNTSYRKDMIPTNKIGFTLRLPSRVAHYMEEYLNNTESKEPLKSELPHLDLMDSILSDQVYYDHVLYDVQAGEKLSDIAELFNVDKYNIRHWNIMSSDELSLNKPLLIHYIKNENKISVTNVSRKFVKRNKITVSKIQSSNKRTSSAIAETFPPFYNKVIVRETEFQNLDLRDHYRLRRGESLQDALRKNPDLSLDEIRSGLITESNPAVGLIISLRPKS
ncbi:MAG: transglycosylase SLT domain-containing protein [Saprospiraceae bacterium]